jgi:predicted Zn-dependent peptidase
MPVAGRLATAIAVLFPAGARHERADEVGAAHLLEHLAFKGTANHPTATELNRAAEYLGTELAGVATTDYVELSTLVRAESVMSALELLTEVAAAPLLLESELEGERSVVLQEIADADENPGSRAGDLLIAALFAGDRLGKSVIGDAADVKRQTLAGLLAFRDRQWTAAGGMVALAGNLEHVDSRALEQLLARIPERPAAPSPARLPPFVPRARFEQRDSNVVHLRLCYQIPGLDLKRRRDRAVAEVFSALIGGPMGSRLFDELRERHALCYWVDGRIWGFESATFLSIGCNVNPAALEEAYERTQAILASLRADGPSDEETSRFRAYTGGAAALDFESVNARLDHAIELIMEFGDHDVDPMLLLREIESVTRAELTQLAAMIQPQPCIGCVGPAAPQEFS